MAKTTDYLFPILAIAASAAGFTFAKWHMSSGAPGLPPLAPAPSNYSTAEDAFALSYAARGAMDLGRAGNLTRPVLYVAGMPEAWAMGLAQQNPDVDVVWAPTAVAAEAFDVASWLGDTRIPWVIGLAVPLSGDGEGEPRTGTVGSNADYWPEILQYARTGGGAAA